jgi:16S rRNA processing protein RimM
VLGKIVGAFGIGGWVKVQSYTDPPENLLRYGQWLLCRNAESAPIDDWLPAKAAQSRATSKGLQVQLEGVADRTRAEQLNGMMIGVPREQLPKPGAGEYYWDDLVGLEAFSPKGDRLGRIADIRATTAHALLSIVADIDGKHVEHLVPLVSERLLKVELDAQRATVDWDPSWS